MRQYVGIPFAQHDCWSLCREVYRNEYQIELPNLGDAVDLDVRDLLEPADGCLVRVVRRPPLAEHWGIYMAGHVLHAQRPFSVMVPLRRFREIHPKLQFFQVRPL